MLELILVLFPMAMVLIFAALWNEETNALELPNYKGGIHWRFDFSARWDSILGDSSKWVTKNQLKIPTESFTRVRTNDGVDDVD